MLAKYLKRWFPQYYHIIAIFGDVYVKHDFKAWDNTPIEKTHLKFCKRCLEISNKVSNVASRSELGRLSLIINIYKNILYYVLYLLRKNEDTIVKQAFRTSLKLHCNGKNSFTIIFRKYLNIMTCLILILTIWVKLRSNTI